MNPETKALAGGGEVMIVSMLGPICVRWDIADRTVLLFSVADLISVILLFLYLFSNILVILLLLGVALWVLALVLILIWNILVLIMAFTLCLFLLCTFCVLLSQSYRFQCLETVGGIVWFQCLLTHLDIKPCVRSYGSQCLVVLYSEMR